MFIHFATISIWMLYIIIVLSTAIVVLLENRQPAKTIAWILVIVGLPIVGLVIFYFFGQNIRKERYIGRKNFDLLTQSILHESDRNSPEKAPAKYERLIRLNERSYRALISSGNSIRLLKNGQEYVDELLKAFQQAHHHIHLMSYIIEDDAVGQVIVDALHQKATQGVEVRVIYDDVGCWNVSNRFFQKMKASGIEVEPFLPVRFPALTHRVNYRNHRKICIVDGSLGFIGGMNIAQRYIDQPHQHWRDLHLRVEGPSVGSLQRIFVSDWYFIKGSLLKDACYFPPYRSTSASKPTEGWVQMVSSNPVSRYPEIMFGLTWIIQHATQHIYFQTPYFMPTDPISQALQTAAMSGVDVRIMLPEKPDSFWLRWGNNSYILPMLEADVKIYFYKKGILHAKCATSDDDWCTVGSSNMDFRSFENNFEANAFIYDCKTATELRCWFQTALNDCEELTLDKWKSRPLSQRFMESATRILSPLL